MNERKTGMNPDSWVVAAGRETGPGAPLNVPLVLAPNFMLGAARSYSRNDGTPTWEALEDLVGGLEGGKAVAFASGMAAVVWTGSDQRNALMGKKNMKHWRLNKHLNVPFSPVKLPF